MRVYLVAHLSLVEVAYPNEVSYPERMEGHGNGRQGVGPPSRLVLVGFGLLAVAGTALAWAGVSIREVLHFFGF